jgi:hypothetical protein
MTDYRFDLVRDGADPLADKLVLDGPSRRSTRPRPGIDHGYQHRDRGRGAAAR